MSSHPPINPPETIRTDNEKRQDIRQRMIESYAGIVLHCFPMTENLNGIIVIQNIDANDKVFRSACVDFCEAAETLEDIANGYHNDNHWTAKETESHLIDAADLLAEDFKAPEGYEYLLQVVKDLEEIIENDIENID